MDRRYEEYEVDTIAAALYDGGWRAEDREWMMEEHGFTEKQVDQICNKMIKLANYEKYAKECREAYENFIKEFMEKKGKEKREKK